MREKMTLQELEACLEVNGGDERRWPAQLRQRIAELAAGSAEARRLIAEARALDHVLAAAPQPARAREALVADRIVTAALGPGRARDGGSKEPRQSAEIIRLADRKRPPGSVSAPSTGLPPGARVAAALAAALLIGVFIGFHDAQRPTVQRLAETMGLGPGVVEMTLAVLPDLGGLEEDIL